MVEQEEALKDENTMVEILRALDQQIERKEDGGLYFLDRIWIPLVEHERRVITWLEMLMKAMSMEDCILRTSCWLH